MRAMSFLIGASVLLLAATGAQGQTLPTSFFNDTLVSGLSEPVGMAFLPDGRLLVCEQRTAAIKLWIGGASMTTVGTVPGVNSLGNEQGLLSVAVDPNWPARPYIYVWYDSNASANLHLAMFTVTGDLSNPASTNLALGSMYKIITDVPDNASNHNGGTIRFGIDGKLYLSIGDDASGCPAQNVSSEVGCVLRIDVASLPGAGAGPPAKATLIPAGNPFAGPTDNARLVWAFGLRNPFRFHIDPVTGFLYIADVGQNLWEEIDECTTGGQNFGWPWMEANQPYTTCTPPQPPSVAPFATWDHASGAGAIMSIGRYRNPGAGTMNFGASYEGDYFYLDYYVGAIRRRTFNGVSWVNPAPVPGQPNANDWATGYTNLADAARGADGAVYYVRQFNSGFGPGLLGRIRANPNAQALTIVSGNNQPGNAGTPMINPLVVRVATIGGTPVVGATVNFAITAGGGSLSSLSGVTDSQGYAQTTYTPSTIYSAAPVITASTPGLPSVTFNLIWRGLSLVYSPILGGLLQITVRHSQLNSAVTFCAETPPPGAPYLTTPYGNVWTSVLGPIAPAFAALDGMGLVGPPNPSIKTGASVPNWSFTYSPIPSQGGQTFIFQAYAVDWSLWPAATAYMVSNTATATIN